MAKSATPPDLLKNSSLYREFLAEREEIENFNGTLTAYLKEEMDAESLNKMLFEKGITLSHLVKRKESLEEQFLTLTKNQ